MSEIQDTRNDAVVAEIAARALVGALAEAADANPQDQAAQARKKSAELLLDIAEIRARLMPMGIAEIQFHKVVETAAELLHQVAGGLVPVEEAVKMLTSLSAGTFPMWQAQHSAGVWRGCAVEARLLASEPGS